MCVIDRQGPDDLEDARHVMRVTGYRSNLYFDPHIEFISADILDLASVEAACANVEAIFHLAASVGNKRSIDDPFTDTAVNAMGTVNVMEAARRRGIERVVVSSSAGAFGELQTMPIAENHPVEPDTPYGASKLFQEKFALSYAKLYGMNVVALRYFNVYGPNQRFDAYGNVIPIFAYSMLRGETVTVFGDGEQTRDFVHVADVANANYLGATVTGASGAFNLGSGSRITINRLLELMQEVSGTARHQSSLKTVELYLDKLRGIKKFPQAAAVANGERDKPLVE